MFNKEGQREASRSIFMGSIKGLANTGAAIATFFVAPLVYSGTIDWVQDFSHSHYGYAWEDLTKIGWGLICGAAVFFGARASVSTVLVMGGMAFAARFL